MMNLEKRVIECCGTCKHIGYGTESDVRCGGAYIYCNRKEVNYITEQSKNEVSITDICEKYENDNEIITHTVKKNK